MAYRQSFEVYVTDLPEHAIEQHIRGAFSAVGTVKNINWMKSNFPGTKNCFVAYDRLVEAQQAVMTLNGTDILSKRVCVRLSKSTQKRMEDQNSSKNANVSSWIQNSCANMKGDSSPPKDHSNPLSPVSTSSVNRPRGSDFMSRVKQLNKPSSACKLSDFKFEANKLVECDLLSVCTTDNYIGISDVSTLTIFNKLASFIQDLTESSLNRLSEREFESINAKDCFLLSSDDGTFSRIEILKKDSSSDTWLVFKVDEGCVATIDKNNRIYQIPEGILTDTPKLSCICIPVDNEIIFDMEFFEPIKATNLCCKFNGIQNYKSFYEVECFTGNGVKLENKNSQTIKKSVLSKPFIPKVTFPKLPNGSFDKLFPNQSTFAKGCEISHILSPTQFFIKKIKTNESEVIEFLIGELFQINKLKEINYADVRDVLQPGDCIIAPFESINYRCVVKEKHVKNSDDSIELHVLFNDYGNECNLLIKSTTNILYHLPQDNSLLSSPSEAVLCELDTSDLEMPLSSIKRDEVVNLIKNNFFAKSVTVERRLNEKNFIDLKTADSPELSLIEFLKSKGFQKQKQNPTPSTVNGRMATTTTTSESQPKNFPRFLKVNGSSQQPPVEVKFPKLTIMKMKEFFANENQIKDVFVTHYLSPMEFYIRKLFDQEQIEDSITTLYQKGDLNPISFADIKTKLQVGDAVVAQFNDDGMFRATMTKQTLLEEEENVIELRFYFNDIGKDNNLKITRECQLSKKTAVLFHLPDTPTFHSPSLAVLCNLDIEKLSISPATSDKALDCVRKFTEDKVCTIVKIQEQTFDLKPDSKSGDGGSLIDHLVQSGFGKMSRQSNILSSNGFASKAFLPATIHLVDGDRVNLLNIVSAEEFYVCRSSDVKDVAVLNTSIQQLKIRNILQELPINRVNCNGLFLTIVPTTGDLARCRILNNNGPKVIALLIDFGEKICPKDIFILPDEFKKYPAFAHRCRFIEEFSKNIKVQEFFNRDSLSLYPQGIVLNILSKEQVVNETEYTITLDCTDEDSSYTIPQAFLQCDEEKEEVPASHASESQNGAASSTQEQRIKALELEMKEMKEIVAVMARKLGMP